MFRINPHAEGFLVEWEGGEEAKGEELGNEIFFRGLRRTRATSSSFVVPRYRNELETLQIMTETCSELGIAPVIHQSLVARRTAGETERSLLASVRKGEGKLEKVPSQLVEFASGRKLLPYQVTAVTKHRRTVHSADFSVPGSGKTSVALATWALERRATPDLGLWVIGPLSCFRPWEEEFEACFGRPAKALRIQGNAANRASLLRHVSEYDFVLTNYHCVWREVEAIARVLVARQWMVVVDEAHYIKSMTGTLATAIRQVAPHAARRLALTGTPMPRSPEDLWSIFTFLWPSQELLGNADQYRQRCKGLASVVCKELGEELSPMFHRTTKKTLGLPAVKQNYPVVRSDSIPPIQRLLLRLVEQSTLSEHKYLSGRDRGHLQRWRRARIIRLMQVASNPLLLAEALYASDIGDDNDNSTTVDDVSMSLTDSGSDLSRALAKFRETGQRSAKIEYVTRRCRELVGKGHKVVIWTVFLGNVELLERVLSDLSPLSITGMVPAYEEEENEDVERSREQRIRLFKEDDKRSVLIANAAACAESISLHKVCQHAIYLERSFNAAHFVQSMDRIHRQGMPKGTTAHIEIPSIPCAIERVLNRRLRQRQQALNDLLNDTMPVIGFDDENHRGYFDVEDLDDIDSLFEEVLAEIKKPSGDHES